MQNFITIHHPFNGQKLDLISSLIVIICIIFSIALLNFVCLITSKKKMSDNPKEAEREMEKAIFISADCWLAVFDLLPPSQLGLGISMISRRFDCYVDEHFKTRKWKLKNEIRIRPKIGENGAMEMKIVNSDEKELPIPQIPLPKKVIGFKNIKIIFFDHNVLTFLYRFHRFFATCETSLFILTENVRILEFLLLNIWPMFKDTTILMHFNSIAFRQMRQFVPSILNDCSSLRGVGFSGGILPEFPPDDSANATDGQAMTRWLFIPHLDNLPKVLSLENLAVDKWLATVEQIKAAFSSASSPVNFVIFIEFSPPFPTDSVVSFKRTNPFTGEHLTLSLTVDDANVFKLVRCPIATDDDEKWRKAMDEWFFIARQNKIEFFIGDGGGDKSLLDSSPGPCGQQ